MLDEVRNSGSTSSVILGDFDYLSEFCSHLLKGTSIYYFICQEWQSLRFFP
jgi:hypothetical protein